MADTEMLSGAECSRNDLKDVDDAMAILKTFMDSNELTNSDENFVPNACEEQYVSNCNPVSNAAKPDKLLGRSETLIHNGDTDSSDDEDNRHCLEPKYSECGKTLRKMLTSEVRTGMQTAGRASGWQNKRSFLLSTPDSKKLSQLPSHTSTDSVFGIRITNPLVSSSVLKEKMQGREMIPLARLKWHTNGNESFDWVVPGVIVRKSSMKTSQKGAQFYIWTLSDLKDDLKTLSLFLFRNAAKDLWKTSVGTIIAVLNPSVLDTRDGSGDEATLSVDNAQRVLIIGTSKDLGFCKAKKKNNEMCLAFVNKNRCEFCVYHLKQEYKKCSGRAELQSASSRGGLMNIRNKVLGKNEVFYAGKSFMAVPAKHNWKQREKDNQRLKSLFKPQISLTQTRIDTVLKAKVCNNQAESDSKRLLMLEQNTDASSSALNKPKDMGYGAKLTEKLKQTDTVRSKSLMLHTPHLSRDSGDLIDFSVSTSKIQKEQAKLTAKKFIELHGPLKKTDPNSVKKDKKRKHVNESIENQDSNKKLFIDQKKAEVISSVSAKPFTSSKFQEMMNASSRHADLLQANEEEAQDQYFQKLEKKESLEMKMLETYKIACKAVRCLTCKYTSFSATERCKSERHPLKVLDAMKRFFRCGHCSNRTTVLEIVPLTACNNCGRSCWQRAPMLRETKRGNIHVQPLSIRGGEETFIGSVSNDANLNLLIPDNDS